MKKKKKNENIVYSMLSIKAVHQFWYETKKKKKKKKKKIFKHTTSDTVREQLTIEDFQDGPHGGHLGYDSDGDVENVKSF